MMQAAIEEYAHALKKGQRELKELLAAGKDPHPAVLDEILPDSYSLPVQDVGLVEIPAERIIGVKSAGRIAAFTPSFRPLLESKSEFGSKWIHLCSAHLGDTGIQDPILCYEYLGDFTCRRATSGSASCVTLTRPGSPALSAVCCLS